MCITIIETVFYTISSLDKSLTISQKAKVLFPSDSEVSNTVALVQSGFSLYVLRVSDY